MVKHFFLLLISGCLVFTTSAADKQIELRVEIYSVPQLNAIELTEAPGNSIDSSELVKKIRALETGGKAKLVTTASIINRSGRRSKVANGNEYTYISGYRVTDDLETPIEKTFNSGTVFEVDPVLSADEITLDANFYITHSNGEPEIKKQTMVGPVSGKDLPFESILLDQAKITTSVVIKDGQTALVGTVHSTDGSGQVLMAFLKFDIR